MPSPSSILSFPLPLVESQKTYAPASLAREVLNLKATPEGVLESVRGPLPFVPDYGSGYPYTGRMHGVFHALLENGQRDTLLVRSGSNLYVQTGWTRDMTVLQSGLSNDPHARFPDQFVEVAGKVVWNNGLDTALCYDGYSVLPLGYDRPPGPPTATGPSDTGHPVFRNQGGYSHPGHIGTQGDFYTAESGALLPGSWNYFVQFENLFGDRSALSPPSGSVVLRRELSTTSYWKDYDDYPKAASHKDLGLLSVNLDDLGRQFLVEGINTGPVGTVARILYRTLDQSRNPNEAHFLVRIPDNVTTVFPDNTADGLLGAVAKDYISLGKFQVMCAHQGCLVVIADGTLRISDPGFPGSFQRERAVPVCSDGAEATAAWSFGGELFAATSTTLYHIEESEYGLTARALTEGLGVVGPEAVAVTPFGAVGMSSEGFWIMTAADAVPQPIGDEIGKLFRRLQPAALSRAVMKWSPRDRELLVAVPYAGIVGNGRLLTWDGSGWKERQYGIAVASMCVLRDWRRDVLIAGKRVAAEENVWTLHGEAQTYDPPTKTYRFRSQWLRADPAGMRRFTVKHIWIGFVEASKTPVTVTVWQNGTRDTAVSTRTVEGINPATADRMDTLVLGTGKLREPRLTWKKVDVHVVSCESFAFDISCEEPTYMSLAAFMFDFVTTDPEGARANTQ